MHKELTLRKDYLKEKVETIYFGGGTPSLISPKFIGELIQQVYREFEVVNEAEITLEANPEDLDTSNLQLWSSIGINRLSIGVQSFTDSVLTWMNRVHNGAQAWNGLQRARDEGFDNISLDLIFALPHDEYQLEADLARCLEFHPEHISTYNLTVEPKTVFGHRLQHDELQEVDEDLAADQYLLIVNALEKAGYSHYEISNFCLPGRESQHNRSYWQQKSYLGIGPSAHSYNRIGRQFNVANNGQYLRAINNGDLPYQEELLSRNQQISELIMTGLRTNTGVDLRLLLNGYQYDLLKTQNQHCQQLLKEGFAFIEENRFILTLKGKLIADQIAADLFVTDD